LSSNPNSTRRREREREREGEFAEEPRMQGRRETTKERIE
jgi:hypothetical protein